MYRANRSVSLVRGRDLRLYQSAQDGQGFRPQAGVKTSRAVHEEKKEISSVGSFTGARGARRVGVRNTFGRYVHGEGIKESRRGEKGAVIFLNLPRRAPPSQKAVKIKVKGGP